MNFKRLRWVVSLPEHGTTAHGRKAAVRRPLDLRGSSRSPANV
jgi:hypothetical protein